MQFYSKSQVVQINSLRFLEHHEASSDGDVGLLSPKFARRRLVLEVELLNRAQVALQVFQRSTFLYHFVLDARVAEACWKPCV